jgi:hypothetical protein
MLNYNEFELHILYINRIEIICVKIFRLFKNLLINVHCMCWGW